MKFYFIFYVFYIHRELHNTFMMNIINALNRVLYQQTNQLGRLIKYDRNHDVNGGADVTKLKQLSDKGIELLQQFNKKLDQQKTMYDDSVKTVENMVGGGHDEHTYEKYVLSDDGIEKLENTRKHINI
jgi:hypothetical protein